VAASIAASLGCKKHTGAAATSPPQAPPVELTVTTPTRATLTRSVRVTGTLYGDEEATIASKVSGRVVQTPVDLGDRVSPGDTLVRIDPVDYALARDERRRALSEALSRLGLTELPPEGGTFDVDAVPLVQRAIVEEQNAGVRFERARELAEADPPLMGPQEFSDIQTAYNVAKSDVAVQRLNAGTILALARTLDIQLRIAEQRLADTEPTAPATDGSDGRPRSYLIAQRTVSVGDFVQVGTPLVRVVAADPVKLRLSVPERRFSEIRIGQPVAVHADAVSGQEPFIATVTRVAPALDIATRTLPIEVVIPNPDLVLKPGGFATAEISVGRAEAIVVPRTAVLTFAGVHKVICIVDGVAQERRVTLGQLITTDAGEMAEIVSGLDGTETIALAPSGSLTTGARVRIAEPE
jgi:RND family efflux transporter MFP subunit